MLSSLHIICLHSVSTAQEGAVAAYNMSACVTEKHLSVNEAFASSLTYTKC